MSTGTKEWSECKTKITYTGFNRDQVKTTNRMRKCNKGSTSGKYRRSTFLMFNVRRSVAALTTKLLRSSWENLVIFWCDVLKNLNWQNLDLLHLIHLWVKQDLLKNISCNSWSNKPWKKYGKNSKFVDLILLNNHLVKKNKKIDLYFQNLKIYVYIFK